MNKDTLRMVIGFGIVVVILIVWQFAFKPKPQPRATPPRVSTTAADTTQPILSATPEPAPAQPVAAPAVIPSLAGTATAETTLVLENDVIRVEFSNVGGAVTSAWLKEYDTDLVPEGGALFSSALLAGDAVIDLSGVPLRARADRRSVTFEVGNDSLHFTKTYTLGEAYALVQRVTLRGADGYLVNALDGVAVTEKNIKDDLAHFHFYSLESEETKRYAVRNLKQPIASEGPSEWVALKSKYFFTAALNPEDGFDSTWVTALKGNRVGFNAVVRPDGSESELTLYFGPLEYNRLRAYGVGLETAVSLGWAKPIALAILWLLQFLYGILGNWGLAIMFFAIIMKAIFFPLTRIQTGQMRRMQQLQPKINELKKKYKDNSQVLNQETMQLYKVYKINPLSGCLPMLVQLPVFWALYSVLRSFIELRGASFIFWLKDLSQPDVLFGHLPFFGNPAIGLLPILMGVSFIAQNMLTSTDKKNWAMTIIFPIFITVIFLNFPSGLQLYWFMYNVLSIVESIIGLKGGKSWLKRRPKTEPSLG